MLKHLDNNRLWWIKEITNKMVDGLPVNASFKPVSILSIFGTSTPGVSRT
jgi:hypothetical protein